MAKRITATTYKTILSPVESAKAYVKLKEIVMKKDILKRDYSYYVLLIIVVLAGFFFSAYQLFIQKHPLAIVGWSILFAFFSVQTGGLIHDAGHRAIFSSTKLNDISGFFFSALVAGGFSGWKERHNTHHAHPNQENEDPDIELPFHSFTTERYKGQKGFGKLLRKYQAWLFFPVRSLAFFSMRYTAIKYFQAHLTLKAFPELSIFLLGLVVWFAAPFFVFGVVKALLILVVVSFTMGIYLSNVFAPNHKGMPEIAKQTKLSFLEQQIVTARNIYGNWVTDFIYMGLNYQIEHHLFPNCPRNRLKLITPHVKELCRRTKLPYTAVSVIESNKRILTDLHQIAQVS